MNSDALAILTFRWWCSCS